MKNNLIFMLALLVIFSSAYGQEKLEVEGAIILQNSDDATPTPGTIRFNSTTNDFEGWNGQWNSLTSSTGPIGDGMLTDIDGNQYLTVTIGTQTWMRENLRVTQYSNGDPIEEVLLFADWVALSTGAWSWYDHDPEKDVPYGKLYNWFAVDDPRGLCPTGWHVPTYVEWEVLINLLGGATLAGDKMRAKGILSEGTGYWADPINGDPSSIATNESGFTGIPAGIRPSDGSFVNINNYAYFWTSTVVPGAPTAAWCRWLDYEYDNADLEAYPKIYGISVRCLMD